MGRIKTMLIKRTVNKIVSDNSKRFSGDFEKNKKVVMDLADVRSKKLRNIIAGSITKQMKEKK